jgi:hypothetical protein
MVRPLNQGGTAVAKEFVGELDASGFPNADAWKLGEPIRFAHDWQGKREDLARETTVALLWTDKMLYLKFGCRYRSLTVFQDSDANGRRDQLWDRDVAEVFIQTDPGRPRRYWEFEISPNGMWIDLGISPEGKCDAKSGMETQVELDEAGKIWTGIVALPMHSLARRFEPADIWRINFFRVEGPSEPRFYSSWQPKRTLQPNFHVPQAFGELHFRKP